MSLNSGNKENICNSSGVYREKCHCLPCYSWRRKYNIGEPECCQQNKHDYHIVPEGWQIGKPQPNEKMIAS